MSTSSTSSKNGNIFHRKNDASKLGIADNNSEIEYEPNTNEDLGSGDSGDGDHRGNNDASPKHFWSGALFGSLIYFFVHVGLIIITFVVLSIWLSYDVSECPVQ
jgi:hypothetical protein